MFYLQVTQMLPTKFRINWPFGSGEAKNTFSRWPPWWPSWISHRNCFSYVLIYKSPRCLLPSLESVGLLLQEKKGKIDFQDCRFSTNPTKIQNNFSFFFLSIRHLKASFYPGSSLMAFRFRRT